MCLCVCVWISRSQSAPITLANFLALQFVICLVLLRNLSSSVTYPSLVWHLSLTFHQLSLAIQHAPFVSYCVHVATYRKYT